MYKFVKSRLIFKFCALPLLDGQLTVGDKEQSKRIIDVAVGNDWFFRRIERERNWKVKFYF